MIVPGTSPVVHLELHSPDGERAGALYAELLAWRPRQIAHADGAYSEVALGPSLGGGIVECGVARGVWLPYVEVADVDATVARARTLGARVLLDPRDGPAGRRSVVGTEAGGEIAFWEPRR
jgi:uncharacterized protein